MCPSHSCGRESSGGGQGSRPPPLAPCLVLHACVCPPCCLPCPHACVCHPAACPPLPLAPSSAFLPCHLPPSPLHACSCLPATSSVAYPSSSQVLTFGASLALGETAAVAPVLSCLNKKSGSSSRPCWVGARART